MKMPSPTKQRWKIARYAALAGYFGLLGLLMLWNIWLAPSRYFPVAMVLIVLVVPLLFPLRGLLHGRISAHLWAGLLALLYFVHGVVEAVSNPAQRWLGLLEIVFSLALFAGALLYVRLRTAERKAPT